VKPDTSRFVEVLEEFFAKFNYGKITLPEDDAALIGQFISYIPPHAEWLRDEYAYDFAAALDCCRRNRNQWAS
jgi:hypothetical protein